MWRILFLILVLMTSTIFAQTAEIFPCDPKPEAVKFYEVGIAAEAELKPRLGEYFQELEKVRSSQGFIINYGLEEEVAEREKIIREMIAFRRYDVSRITFVRGGNEIRLKSEFWIVPSGADYPTPNYDGKLIPSYNIKTRNDVRVVKSTQITSIGCGTVERSIKIGKFDSFGKVSERYFNWTLKEFAENLAVDKSLKGYVVNYGSDEEINDLENRIRNFESLKNIFGTQVIFIKGKFRKEPITQLWIVAEGSEPPKP